MTTFPLISEECDRVQCDACEGSGMEGIMVAVCCERPRNSGECCANPVGGLDVVPCSECGGVGWFLERAHA